MSKGLSSFSGSTHGSVSVSVALLLLAAGSLALVFPSFSEANAETLNPWVATTSYPSNTSGLSCTTSGGFVYCLGDGTNAVYYASISSSGVGAWKPTTSYPSKISGVSCAATSAYIYCVAGINGSLGPRPTTQVFYAQLSASGGIAGAWQKTTNYPAETIGPSCVISGSDIYCVGGGNTVGTLQTNAAYFAPISASGVGTWTAGTSYPQTVDGLSCLAAGGYMYCFAGYTANGPKPISSTYSSALSASGFGPWSTGTSYPMTDFGLSCVAISGYAYCIGGQPTGGQVTNKVYYSPISGGSIGPWTSTTNYPTTIEGESCVTSGTTIACIAGDTQGGYVEGNSGASYYTSVASQQSSANLVVGAQDLSGHALSGYYTALFQSGNLVNSGYTPATFTLSTGQTYVVQVDDYGSCHFSHWADTGSSSASRSISISGDTSITAVYDCGSGGGGASSVTVQSVDQSGNAIFGYYTILTDSSGNTLGTGYTTKTFATTAGSTYGVEADSYGSCNFAKWSDGVTSDPRTFTASASVQTFTAVYDCGGSSGGGTSTIGVSTVSSAGSTISGYYVTLWQNGAQLQSCFSACSFTVNNGQTYQVAASSYGSETFSHWQNDGSTGYETVSVPGTSTTISLTAVYSP